MNFLIRGFAPQLTATCKLIAWTPYKVPFQVIGIISASEVLHGDSGIGAPNVRYTLRMREGHIRLNTIAELLRNNNSI
jgi:hypothetical protein